MSDLESRVSALEAALALPSNAASPLASSTHTQELTQRVAQLEKELVKASYRIQHLVRAYDAKQAEIERLTAATTTSAK